MTNEAAQSPELLGPPIRHWWVGYRLGFGRNSDFGSLPIPKRLRPKAQGFPPSAVASRSASLRARLLRRTGEARATLGKRREKQQPQRGCDQRRTFTKAETPSGFCFPDALPRGSSGLATLGFVAES